MPKPKSQQVIKPDWADRINQALLWRGFRRAIGVGFIVSLLVLIFPLFLMGMVSGVMGTASPVAHFFESLIKVADLVMGLPESGVLFHVAFFWGIAAAIFTFGMTVLGALFGAD
jgi:hypothetical protein